MRRRRVRESLAIQDERRGCIETHARRRVENDRPAIADRLFNRAYDVANPINRIGSKLNDMMIRMALRRHARRSLGKFINDRTKRRPAVIPVVMEV